MGNQGSNAGRMRGHLVTRRGPENLNIVLEYQCHELTQELAEQYNILDPQLRTFLAQLLIDKLGGRLFSPDVIQSRLSAVDNQSEVAAALDQAIQGILSVAMGSTFEQIEAHLLGQKSSNGVPRATASAHSVQ